MKKLNIVTSILMILSVLIQAGCSDQILNKEPQTSFTEDDVWGDINLVQKYVATTYNGLGSRGITENMYSGRRIMLDTATDNGFWMFDYGMWTLNNGTISSDNMGVFTGRGNPEIGVWASNYNYIRKVNIFLKKIDDLKGDQQQLQSLKGQMKYIRAHAYAELINYFGGVPLITKVFKLNDDYKEKRASYQKVMNFIVDELDEAKKLVPENYSSDNWGRVTKGACLALKSQQLLYAASKLHKPSTEPNGPLFDYEKNDKWKDAADAAKAVVDMPQYSLIKVDTWKDYQKLFLKPNSEIIFGRSFSSEYGPINARPDNANSPNGYGGVSGSIPSQDLIDHFEMADGKEIHENGSGYNLSPDSIYKDRELRFYADIVYNGAMFRGRKTEFFLPGGKDSKDGREGWNYAKTGYTLRKFQDETINFSDERGTTPYIYFRLAGIYLNYAEAEYHLGNESIARKYVNKLRNRVHLPDINSSGQNLLEDIRHERRIELAFEGQRFYDVRRWMIANSTANKDLEGIAWNKLDESGNFSPTGTLQYHFVKVQERAFHKRNYYLPIPLSEIQKADLAQNPGY